MVLQIVAGVAWLLWLSSGTAGLKNGFLVGALLLIGLGVRRFLDVIGKGKDASAVAERRPVFNRSAFSHPQGRGVLPSSNWNLNRFSGREDSGYLPRLGQ